MITPFTPNQAKKAKEESIPEVIIEIINEFLAKRYTDSGSIIISQEEVISEIMEKMNVTSKKIFANNWLDFEGLYQKAGWHVSFDKPAFNESYQANWTFKRK